MNYKLSKIKYFLYQYYISLELILLLMLPFLSMPLILFLKYISRHINSFIKKFLYMQEDWQFPQKKQFPLSITFKPYLIDNSETFINPFLGYPNCPIIGRYNQGEYKIGQTLMQIQFKCSFNKNTQLYHCGQKVIMLPEIMHYNIRNIPQIVPNNKPQNLKNVPDFLPEKYPVIDELSVIWIVSFGELGKDFLNYLNHMYILANTLFQQDKLPRQVHYLPIYAYLPHNSGLNHEEVERGLNFNQYRGQYMSFHLKKGAPAFSPNNMRLGVEGGKIITSKQPQKKQSKKGKQKYIEKQKNQGAKQIKKQEIKKHPQGKPQDDIINWDQLQNQTLKITKTQAINKVQAPKQSKFQHQGFIHFYSSVLLENDYRIYYHWHIQDHYKEDLIRQMLRNSISIDDLLQKYHSVLGKDALYLQISRLIFPQNL